MGPEWWYARSPAMQMQYETLDALARCLAASAMTAMAMGAKGAAVQRALSSVPSYPRPWAPPVPKRNFADRVHSLLTHLGR